ncbi:DUF2271 domain-containing protein [Deinococcus sp.]|uniref:DUF2271 domain-containing protein n=1 Tax=Deinococcus sp. TaxID=47478 RepID=UPI003C7B3E0A
MTKPTPDRRRFLGHTAAAALALALGRFSSASAAAPTTKAAAGFDPKMELAVQFSIGAAASGFFQRPYVAVWLEDAAGNEVRTLSVWAKTDPRGLRYLEHLTRWIGVTGSRQDTLLSTVSSPTRSPGSYTLVWDGKNDKGVPVAQGDYFLCVESAREHGPYALIREKIGVGGAAGTHKIAGNGDIGDVNASYRKRA